MKKWLFFFLFGILLFSLAGCSPKEKPAGPVNDQPVANTAPVYGRSISPYRFAENANLYMTAYAQNGFYYFTVSTQETAEASEDDTAEDVDPQIRYQFYYQPYDGSAASRFCSVQDGIVRAFSGITENGKDGLAVLQVGDEACILKFDEAGKSCKKTVIEEQFNTLDEFLIFLACPDGTFLIGAADQVFYLDSDGQIKKTLPVEGHAEHFYRTEENELYATVREDGSSALSLVKLDIQRGTVEEIRKLQSGIMEIFPFADSFISIFGDRATAFRPGQEGEENLIDLNRQSILASQIRYIYGNRDEIKIVSIDSEQEGCLMTLKKGEVTEPENTAKDPEEPLYSEDGRRIVRVVIPKNHAFQTEFHAKKYNQISDKAFVKVERLEEDLETYLGKGNRPDIIMFNDHTEIAAYVQKNALADLSPLFQAQDTYSLDDIVPKVKEILGIEDGNSLYAVARYFRLLMRTTDGTEYGADGNCDSIRYLQWYDQFLTENDVPFIGQTELLLYGALDSFYDETTAQASFTSEEFKEFMRSYKEVCDRHNGTLSWSVEAELGVAGFAIARGPLWLGSYSLPQIAVPGVKMEGTPGMDGADHVYMRLENPMSIMSTSDCQEEAFDFLMYYNSLPELLMKGDSEGSYGKGGSTYAIFSTYEHLLTSEIYESERPYINDLYFTEEQSTQLKELIHRSVPITKAQNDIYAMVTEETEAYLKGAKDLDSVCAILQSRAEIYLQERKQ